MKHKKTIGNCDHVAPWAAGREHHARQPQHDQLPHCVFRVQRPPIPGCTHTVRPAAAALCAVIVHTHWFVGQIPSWRIRAKDLDNMAVAPPLFLQHGILYCRLKMPQSGDVFVADPVLLL